MLRHGTVLVDGSLWLVIARVLGARRRGGGSDLGPFFLKLAYLRIECECHVIFIVDHGSVVDEMYRKVLDFFGRTLVEAPADDDGEKVYAFLERSADSIALHMAPVTSF